MSGRDKAKSSENLPTRSSWENCKDCSRANNIQDLQRSVRETGIRWYVAHPDDPNDWPAEFRDQPAFESSAYRVYDMPTLFRFARLIFPGSVPVAGHFY